MMKKKFLAILITLLSCIALPCLLIGCDNTNNDNQTPAVSDTDLLAFSAATSANILSALSTPDAMPTAANVSPNPTDTQVEKIHEQILILENFINDTPFTVTESASDRPAYTKMLRITASDLENHATTYLLYYNETPKPVDPDDRDTEKEYYLNGTIALNGKEYAVRGEKELDTRKNEYDISLSVSLDNATYVKFDYETETNEREYEYKIYRNGNCVKMFSLDTEQRAGKQYIEMKSAEAGGMRIKYDRESENGQSYIKANIVEAAGPGITVKVFVTHNAAGATVYRYVFYSGEVKEIVVNPSGTAPAV